MSSLKGVSNLKNRENRCILRISTLLKWMPVLMLSLSLLSGCEKDDNDSVYVTDDFNDGVADNFVDDGSGFWVASDTSYVMTGTGTDGWTYSCYTKKTYTDFELSVDITAIANNTNTGAARGVFFRSQSTNATENSFCVVIAGSSYWIGKYVDGSQTTSGWISTENLNLDVGSTNNLKVVCSGSSIEVLINGVSEGTYTYTDFTSGYVGFVAYDHSGYTNTFVFDNFLINEIASTKSTVAGIVQPEKAGDCNGDPTMEPAGI